MKKIFILLLCLMGFGFVSAQTADPKTPQLGNSGSLNTGTPAGSTLPAPVLTESAVAATPAVPKPATTKHEDGTPVLTETAKRMQPADKNPAESPR